MVSLKDFLPDLLPYVGGCPEPVALRALRMSARRFCYDTWAITTDSGVLMVNPGQVELDLSDAVDTGLVPIGLVQMELAGTKYQLMGRYGSGIKANDALTITLPSAPSTPTPFRGVIAVAPNMTTESLPDELGYRWRDGVVAGAAAYLAGVPATTYASPDVAVAGAAKYMRVAGDARIEAYRLYGGQVMVRARRFA